MFGWIKNRKKGHLKVDVHSHLLPGIDDGVKTWGESLSILGEMANLGYEKVITTPHIHSDYYLNTASEILTLGSELKQRVERANLPMIVEYAAEYMVNEHFMELLSAADDLLYFGEDKYVLIETGFHFKSLFLDEALFQMQSRGYTPVLAHPERYNYLDNALEFARDLKERGVKLQVSTMSLENYYGSTVRKKAKRLLKEGLADFMGSDLHRQSQIALFEKSLNNKAICGAFLNNMLV